MGNMDTRISVVMPVYNGEQYIVKSLPPLIQLLEQGKISELIVVDDSSTDNSRQIAESMGARIIETGGRLGPGGGRNIAAKQAVGDILWFIDADVIVHEDAVDYISREFADTRLGALFGSYDDSPPAQNFLSQYKNMVHHFYHSDGRREASTFWSGCGAVNKEVFLKLGGFDIEMFKRPSIEDIELGYRIVASGKKIVVEPEMKSTHLKVWRLFNLLHTEIFCRAIPWSRLMLRQSGLIDELNVTKGERVRAILAGLQVIVIILAVLGVIPLWVVGVVIAIALYANAKFIRFFYKRKSLMFTIGAYLYHQLYYIYSAAAYVYSWLELKFTSDK